MTEPGAGFDSRGLGLKAQKKLLGKMSSKKIARVFIDDTTGRVLDNTYKIVKDFYNNKKDSEKLLKYIIKTVVKIGILYRNDQFNLEELTLVDTFKQKFHSLAMTIISFHEVDFTFDKNFLRRSIEECNTILQCLVNRHLTDKSKNRIDIVFGFFTSSDFLEAIFQQDSKYYDLLDNIVADMHRMMDEGNL